MRINKLYNWIEKTQKKKKKIKTEALVEGVTKATICIPERRK